MREVWYNEDMNERDFTLTGAERVEIPPHCANCPIAHIALRQLEEAYTELNNAMSASIDPEITESIQGGTRDLALAHGCSEEEAVAISERAAGQVREQISKRADYLDDRAADLIKITRDCPGTTTMRAKARGGAIQATLCMNENLIGPGKDIEPVSVTRSSS